jgi:hypothetical protein
VLAEKTRHPLKLNFVIQITLVFHTMLQNCVVPKVPLMKSSPKNTQVVPVNVPEALKGRRAGVFFLLNQLELRKSQAKAAASSDVAPAKAQVQKAVEPDPQKPFPLTDEFIFS